MIMILIVNDNNTQKIIIKKKTPTPFLKKDIEDDASFACDN